MTIIVYCENEKQAHDLLQYLWDEYNDDVALRAIDNTACYFTRYRQGYCYRLNKEGQSLRMLGHCDHQHYESAKNAYGVAEITSYKDFEAEYIKEEVPVELLDFLGGFAK